MIVTRLFCVTWMINWGFLGKSQPFTATKISTQDEIDAVQRSFRPLLGMLHHLEWNGME